MVDRQATTHDEVGLAVVTLCRSDHFHFERSNFDASYQLEEGLNRFKNIQLLTYD